MTALEKLRREFELLKPLTDEVTGEISFYKTMERELGEALELHIIQIDSALKAVEDEQRWVPVEERLPNDYSEVLISVTTSEGNSKVLSGGIGLRDDGQRVWCFLWERPIPITDENVTHWRPMPEGPRKKAEQE